VQAFFLREESMPSSAAHCPTCRQALFGLKTAGPSRGFWPSIVRIFILEVVLLVGAAGAVVFYLNWSSEMALADFLAVSKTPAAPSSSLSAVKAAGPCDRGA
jgi:hypothetical protein